MNEGRLGQPEREDLSAYLDGELPPQRAAQIDGLIGADPAWREAYEQIRSLDEALGAYTVPDSPAGLSERIIRAAAPWPARAISRVGWVAAAAAAILLVVTFGLPERRRRAPAPRTADELVENVRTADELVENVLKGVQPDDRFVVEHLEFFRDYDVLVDLETLEAVARLEAGERGT